MSADGHLFEIFSALAQARVQFIVAGGVAVVLHGVERSTMDLDLSVQMEKQNLERFLAVMKNLGMVPRVPVSPEVLLDPAQRSWMVKEKRALVFTFIHPDKPFQQVDVFLLESLDFSKLEPATEEMDIEGLKTRVLSKRQLIELKKQVMPPRDKDIFDIAALEELLRKSPK